MCGQALLHSNLFSWDKTTPTKLKYDRHPTGLLKCFDKNSSKYCVQ